MEEVTLQLSNVREQLRARLQEVESALRPLEEEHARLKAQLDHIDRALVAGGAPVEKPDHRAAANDALSISDVVAQILSEDAKPLHISVIRERFLASGRTIPGQGSESNLLVYMLRDPRFSRVSKGTYALKPNDAMQDTPTPAGRTRRRRRKRRSK